LRFARRRAHAAGVALPRRVLYPLLALAPFVLLTAAGRRLSPYLMRAFVRAFAIGAPAGGLWLYALVTRIDHPGDLAYAVFVVLPVLMALTEAVVATWVVAGKLGQPIPRILLAWLGAFIGHVAWTVMLLLFIEVLPRNELLIAAIVVVPAALLGACGAALGAILIEPRS
jgi:hypothetical protein